MGTAGRNRPEAFAKCNQEVPGPEAQPGLFFPVLHPLIPLPLSLLLCHLLPFPPVLRKALYSLVVFSRGTDGWNWPSSLREPVRLWACLQLPAFAVWGFRVSPGHERITCQLRQGLGSPTSTATLTSSSCSHRSSRLPLAVSCPRMETVLWLLAQVGGSSPKPVGFGFQPVLVSLHRAFSSLGLLEMG